MKITKDECTEESVRNLRISLENTRKFIKEDEVALGIRKSPQEWKATIAIFASTPFVGGVVSIFAESPSVEEFISNLVVSTGILLGFGVFGEAKDFVIRKQRISQMNAEDYEELQGLRTDLAVIKSQYKVSRHILRNERENTRLAEKDEASFQKAIGSKPFNPKHS